MICGEIVTSIRCAVAGFEYHYRSCFTSVNIIKSPKIVKRQKDASDECKIKYDKLAKCDNNSRQTKKKYEKTAEIVLKYRKMAFYYFTAIF